MQSRRGIASTPPKSLHSRSSKRLRRSIVDLVTPSPASRDSWGKDDDDDGHETDEDDEEVLLPKSLGRDRTRR